MQVSNIEEIDKNRRIVFIDGEEAFTLYKNEINKFKLELYNFISNELYDEIIAMLNKRAKIKIMDSLKRSDQPERELRNKLKKARFPESCIEVAIDYVKQYGYINDTRYAENYIRLKKMSKSRQSIESDLKRKGLDSSLIKECIDSEYSIDDELEVINKQITKKCKDINLLDHNTKNKLAASLCRKGFSYEKVRKCLSLFEHME